MSGFTRDDRQVAATAAGLDGALRRISAAGLSLARTMETIAAEVREAEDCLTFGADEDHYRRQIVKAAAGLLDIARAVGSLSRRGK